MFNLQSFPNNPDDIRRRLRQMPDTRSRLQMVITDFATAGRHRKDLLDATMSPWCGLTLSPGHSPASGGMQLVAQEITRLGKQSGEIRPDLVPDILAAWLGFACMEANRAPGQESNTLDGQKWIDTCIDLMIHGVHQP